MQRWMHSLVVVMAALASATAHAERYAVLVGVSELAHQPRSLWLDGPRHDVAAVQATLAAQGITAARTTVLADGVAGATLPTQAAILQAMDALTPRLVAGDSVLLYWSGHGVRNPSPRKASQEPDGLDEYREEYNKMLLDKSVDANGILQEKYVTVTVAKKNIEEARAYFARVGQIWCSTSRRWAPAVQS